MSAPDSRLSPLFTIDLSGSTLVEAGAGTGKTHLITGLFFRALLEGDECPVDRILMVTFTNAATRELTLRIRKGLEALLFRLLNPGPPIQKQAGVDELLWGIICLRQRSGTDRPENIRTLLVRRLQNALDQLGQSRIMTIHAFFLRTISEYALETALPFDRTLVSSDREIWMSAITRVYRKEIEGGTGPFFRYLLKRKLVLFRNRLLRKPVTPATLYSLYAGYASHPPDRPASDPEDLHQAIQESNLYDRLHALRDEVLEKWELEREALLLLLEERLKGNVYTRASREKWAEWFDGQLRHPFFPEYRAVERWEQSRKIKASSKAVEWEAWGESRLNRHLKGAGALFHPILVLIDQIAETAELLSRIWERRLGRMLVSMKEEISREMNRQKKAQATAFYEDITQDFREAIGDPLVANALFTRLASRFSLVLVDEFQDTDPVQTSIFSRWRELAGTPFVFVGDPKQSIYRFRGADLSAYLRFKERFSGSVCTLQENFRSTPDLIKGFNTLFGRHRFPFLIPGIPYSPVLPRRGKPESSLPEGVPSIRLWKLGQEEQIPASHVELKARLALQIAREIASWRSSPDEGKERTGKIAVLVRSHAEGEVVRKALSEAGIPVSTESRTSVYQTWEAHELEWILEAIWDPGDEGSRILALGSRISGHDSSSLTRLRENTSQWESVAVRFFRLRAVWLQYGIYAAFRMFWSAFEVESRLVLLRDSDRIRTNVWHLLELLNQAEQKGSLLPEELIRFLSRERGDDRDPETEETLRSDSGTDRVSILTIHKSKGLEFDRVFCPFLWIPITGWNPENPPDLLARDSPDGRSLRVVPDVNGSDLSWWKREELAEQLRFLYVAVTRAREHVTLFWDPRILADPQYVLSSLGWILQGHSLQSFPDHIETESLFSDVTAWIGSRTEEERWSDFEDLLARSGGSIRSVIMESPWCDSREFSEQSLPTVSGIRPESLSVPHPLRDDPSSAGPIAFGKTWDVTSFTRLTRGKESIWEERSGQDEHIPFDLEIPPLDLPPGSRSGILLHQLLESIDFGSERDLDAVLPVLLRQYGLEGEGRLESVRKRILSVLATPLEPGKGFRLRDIPKDRTIREMEFTFPVDGFSANRLYERLGQAGYPLPSGLLRTDGGMNRLRGFLNGALDLVFWKDGRFHLADYKSNVLGQSVSDYRPERIDLVMVREGYYLQAFLYSIALHKYLSVRVDGYSYSRMMGDVFYLFLRGMDPALTGGVMRWRFPEELVVEGSDLLYEVERDPARIGRGFLM
ncbi:MAG: UvrD-helicase domain-containing protein [Leptospirales bacterium]